MSFYGCHKISLEKYFLYLFIRITFIMEDIILSQEKADFYGELVDNWSMRTFETVEQQQEFILLLKNLLDENRNEMEFEVIIQTVNILTGCVDLKKFRPSIL